MALRINTNIAAINAHRQLVGTEMALGKSMERLSSGFRINRAADDAAGLAIANRLRAEVRSLTVASRNVTEAKSMLNVAEGSANQIEGILERMKELATQAASANTSVTDKAKLNAEYQQLILEIDRIVDDTNYQGDHLLDGSFSGTFQVGSGAQTHDQLTVSIGQLDSATLGLTGDLLSAGNAVTEITALDGAIDTLSTSLGNIGAAMNRLDYTYANLLVSIENFSASESVIRDADMAMEMVGFTKNQILLQAGTAMLAQANMSTQAVLSLFG
ncbi:MAG TPA: flagellin FliC [Deltaproteobacteria bacterium]|nr:flagellin FliC [Deltaproteobacteria bacterium]